MWVWNFPHAAGPREAGLLGGDWMAGIRAMLIRGLGDAFLVSALKGGAWLAEAAHPEGCVSPPGWLLSVISLFPCGHRDLASFSSALA